MTGVQTKAKLITTLVVVLFIAAFAMTTQTKTNPVVWDGWESASLALLREIADLIDAVALWEKEG